MVPYATLRIFGAYPTLHLASVALMENVCIFGTSHRKNQHKQLLTKCLQNEVAQRDWSSSCLGFLAWGKCIAKVPQNDQR